MDMGHVDPEIFGMLRLYDRRWDDNDGPKPEDIDRDDDGPCCHVCGMYLPDDFGPSLCIDCWLKA